jgi:membrane-associated protease RseP (regulator of RpoE activity)
VCRNGWRSVGKVVLETLLGFHVGVWHYATSDATRVYVASVPVQESQSSKDLCGVGGGGRQSDDNGIRRQPCMAEPYGAIFDQPEAGGPTAAAGIEQGDVLTAINDSPLMRASDFGAHDCVRIRSGLLAR